MNCCNRCRAVTLIRVYCLDCGQEVTRVVDNDDFGISMASFVATRKSAGWWQDCNGYWHCGGSPLCQTASDPAESQPVTWRTEGQG